MMHQSGKRGDKDLNELRLHLKRALKTLKVQPYKQGDRPNGLISSHLFSDVQDSYGGTSRLNKNSLKATPKQITHMQFWLDQLSVLDVEQRRIIMARAAGISWRRLEELDGRSHTTLRKHEKLGLSCMLGALSKGKSILPKDLIA